MTQIRNIMFDALLEMKDAGLVAASAAAQVDAVDKILDLGESYYEANLVVDVTAIEVASADEKYEIEFQLSDSATFASGNVCSVVLKLGDSSVNGSSADSAVGRYIVPVRNEFADTIYRYARLYTRIAGTIATGINYSAFLSPR